MSINIDNKDYKNIPIDEMEVNGKKTNKNVISSEDNTSEIMIVNIVADPSKKES